MRGGAVAEAALYVAAAVLFALGRDGGSGGAFAPASKAEGALRVVTWNVGGAGGAAGRPLDDADVPAVAAALRELSPDLVVLQEVGSRGQVHRLVEALGDGGWRSVLGRGGGRRLAAVSRGGNLDTFWTGDRDVLGLTLDLDRFAAIAVVGVHADAWSSSDRNATVGAAVDLLLERSAPGGRLLLGDLNLDVDVDKRRDLFSDDAHLDVETYNYAATRLVDTTRGTGATAEPDRRLDYVFADRRLRAVAGGAWKGRRVGAMDHDPVVVDLLPANGGR